MTQLYIFLVIQLTNLDRDTPVKYNSKLTQAAQKRADDMNETKFFSHDTLSGKENWSYITDEGYSYCKAGENLAVNFNTPWEMHRAWMESKGHRENIVNKNFKDIGIGVSGKYVVEYLAEPCN